MSPSPRSATSLSHAVHVPLVPGSPRGPGGGGGAGGDSGGACGSRISEPGATVTTRAMTLFLRASSDSPRALSGSTIARSVTSPARPGVHVADMTSPPPLGGDACVPEASGRPSTSIRHGIEVPQVTLIRKVSNEASPTRAIVEDIASSSAATRSPPQLDGPESLVRGPPPGEAANDGTATSTTVAATRQGACISTAG